MKARKSCLFNKARTPSKKDICTIKNIFKSLKVHNLIRFQQAVSSCEMWSKIVQSEIVLVSKCSFKLVCVEKIAGDKTYVLHKKIAEKSLNRLLLLFIFLLFYFECIKTGSYISISGNPSKLYDRAFLWKDWMAFSL